MLPASWKPIDAGGLIRLGSPRDGGYVVSERAVRASRLLISMGLNDDWQFEKEFRKLADVGVVCFDHSVTWKFWLRYYVEQALRLRWARLTRYLDYRWFFSRPGVEHRPIRIGYDQPGEVSVAGLLKEFTGNDIFLKIDIEGSEYRILDDLVKYSDRFTSVVMEFHDIDLNRDRIARFVEGMANFKIVFLHANNYGGSDGQGDPLVIEMSFVRKDLLDPVKPGEARPELPANTSRLPDIELRYAPVDTNATAGASRTLPAGAD
ncbi:MULTISPECIES: FkbM family methyltransferase [unclassified Ensifer]|uniref:FkbM family methyltransferase n=1 Tax=unclassified Ensifer TaxID=2633371 RepID=UPI000812F38F|nr:MULTISPECIES: FkbM family methyltransferase [unclassified Ensifer]OCP19464.1 hypothetical protein BC361_30685 [Ensifer sp. LC54]OCP19570.1 hypothetical protein BC363_30835 [Ensifer sp. LC384]